MAYQPLTPEQNKAARSKFTPEQIISFEQKRQAAEGGSEQNKPKEESFTQQASNVLGSIFGGKTIGDAIGTAIVKNDVSRGKYDSGVDYGALSPEAKQRLVARGVPITAEEQAQQTANQIQGPTATQVAGDVLKTAALPVGIFATGGTSLLGQMGVGAATGYAYDVGSSFESGQSAGDALKPGAATVAGLVLPPALRGAGALTSFAAKATAPVFRGVGNLVQKGSKVAGNELASDIMQRVARVRPVAQENFKKQTGESIGEYLTSRGIYGNDEEILQKLADRFTKSKELVDTELVKLPGEFQNGRLTDALDALKQREQLASSPNVPSPDLARITELEAKHKATGLTMSEINEVKRLYERKVKLGYLKEKNTIGIDKATYLDNSLREWQLSQADIGGLQNLRELNRETKAAKQLGDELFKTVNRGSANNALGLTDAILLSGGDPSGIAMYLTKKTFGSKSVQSAIAKGLADSPTKAEILPIKRGPITDESRLLSQPTSDMSTLNQGRPIKVFPAKPNTEYVGKDAVVKPTVDSTMTLPQQSLPKSELPSLPPTVPPTGPQSNIGGGKLFAGAIGGIQQDENGNLKLDPKAFSASLALGTMSPRVARNAVSKLERQRATILSRATKNPQKLAQEDSVLKTIDYMLKSLSKFL